MGPFQSEGGQRVGQRWSQVREDLWGKPHACLEKVVLVVSQRRKSRVHQVHQDSVETIEPHFQHVTPKSAIEPFVQDVPTLN